MRAKYLLKKEDREEQSMKKYLENATWIWSNPNPKEDEYSEFVDQFIYESGNVVLQISADSNYAAYINGKLAAWGQYADFPYDKVYDQVDVTAFCQKGDNRIAIIVWYYGLSSIFTYYPGKAGLLYSLVCDDTVLCESSERTLSRKSVAYMNHRKHMITPQIGYGYGYDFTKEDDWLTGELVGFEPSAVVCQTLPLRIRPCDKLTLLPEVTGVKCKELSETKEIYDLGSEQVGFLSFEIESPCEQDITIAYGEHLVDGCVRRHIEPRDFSVSFRMKKGENVFLNPFRRFACRYLEIHSEYPVKVGKIGITPTMYVLEEIERPVLSEIQNKIYDMCVETLRLCMHEHYEDCPWREQSLYAMDSRNQMLCGYYAFGEYKFPRANLELISKDRRADGLLSICYPMELDLVIPSFSLHYITACREYMLYSGDKAFIEGIYPKLVSIVETFTKRITEGLLYPFPGVNYWNFYEWREGLDGGGPYCEDFDCTKPDVLINALLSIALQNLALIADELGVANTYGKQAEELNIHIYRTFFDEESGICYDYPEHKAYSQLGNALAVLCGAVTGEYAKELCKRLFQDTQMTPVSLSMLCFKYDACVKVDKEYFAPMILEDIQKIYTPMIEFGGTTVWETELGESDFDNAGSLCHGWSALPIYYYHILSK